MRIKNCWPLFAISEERVFPLHRLSFCFPFKVKLTYPELRTQLDMIQTHPSVMYSIWWAFDQTWYPPNINLHQSKLIVQNIFKYFKWYTNSIGYFNLLLTWCFVGHIKYDDSIFLSVLCVSWQKHLSDILINYDSRQEPGARRKKHPQKHWMWRVTDMWKHSQSEIQPRFK